MSRSVEGRIVNLDGGTEAIIHPDGKVYLTGYHMPSQERGGIPMIYLNPKDSIYLAYEIIKYVNIPEHEL